MSGAAERAMLRKKYLTRRRISSLPLSSSSSRADNEPSRSPYSSKDIFFPPFLPWRLAGRGWPHASVTSAPWGNAPEQISPQPAEPPPSPPGADRSCLLANRPPAALWPSPSLLSGAIAAAPR